MVGIISQDKSLHHAVYESQIDPSADSVPPGSAVSGSNQII